MSIIVFLKLLSSSQLYSGSFYQNSKTSQFFLLKRWLETSKSLNKDLLDEWIDG